MLTTVFDSRLPPLPLDDDGDDDNHGNEPSLDACLIGVMTTAFCAEV